MFAKILTAIVAITSSSVYAYGPQSELDKAMAYVDSYINSNNLSDKENNEKKSQLTNLLKGFAGIELSIYFKTDSADIDKQGRHQIYQIAKTLWVYPDPTVRLRLDAYTDVRGSKKYNLKLSEKRLAAVQKVFMNAMGDRYDEKRFYTGIKGETRASYSPKDEEGMSLDRKVTITLFVQS